ncbi:MAG TPA: hypothetical protein VK536_01175 [Candidatus Limnocylindrales bacterium]|nr:hypothetical protein [Candidatus Limnocylindrales bacterium]
MLVIPSEEGADACDYAVGMFNASFEYLGINLVGKLLPKVSERAEVKKQPESINEALKLGKSLK